MKKVQQSSRNVGERNIGQMEGCVISAALEPAARKPFA